MSAKLGIFRRAIGTQSLGFTLVEVVFALAIMTLAFSSILAVESGSINATTRAKTMNIVGMLAKNQMVETEFKLQGKQFSEVAKDESGRFEAPYEDYRWETKIKEVNFPNLLSLAGGDQSDKNSSGGTGTENSMAQMVGQTLTNFLSKGTRQVTVTVFWKQGSKEQSFSLSTFWVDLNYEVPLQ